MSKSKGRKLAEWLRGLDANSKASSDSIKAGSITTAKLDDGAVTTAKMGDLGVTFGKLHTALVVTESGGIGNNDNDSTIATSAAIIDYVANNTPATYGDSDVASYLSTNGFGTSSSIIASITDSAPTTLDTLNELAAALGDDANFSTTTATSLGNRLRIDVNNQGLTTAQKSNAVTNLGLATVSTTGAYSDLTGTPTIPTNNNQLTNGAGYITNGSNYDVNDAWLRENGDNADVKLYGNSRVMTFRTDGDSGGTGGDLGSKTFRWTYGGNNNGHTQMYLNTSGQLWVQNYGLLHDGFIRRNSASTHTSNLTMNGYLIGGADGHRHKGIYGNYDSYRINNIWSMGTSYVVDSNGGSFGNLYGMAYTYHNRVYTSNTMGQYHQMVWCNNGTPYCALGRNVWTSGNVTAYSDIRVKENLEIIPNALEKVSKLNGYTFDRTDIETDNEGNTPKKRQAGVVAQEVLEVLPEVVSGNEDDPDGHLSVAYGNMVGLLIEAIKEQQEQIEELKARLQ